MICKEYWIAKYTHYIIIIGNPEIRRNLMLHWIIMSRVEYSIYRNKWSGNKPNTTPTSSWTVRRRLSPGENSSFLRLHSICIFPYRSIAHKIGTIFGPRVSTATTVPSKLAADSPLSRRTTERDGKLILQIMIPFQNYTNAGITFT